MKKSALVGFASVLIAGTAMAASNPAFVTHQQAQRFITGVPPGSKTLYDQNKDSAGTAVFSQNLDNTQGADDFVVPKGHTWIIKEVDVTGVYFNGSGADSENVFFYRDKGGLPGDLVSACPNQNGTDGGFGSFAIVLSDTCKVKLRGGRTYWVSVQANLEFGNDEWGWEQSTDTNGNKAAWQNPGGGDCQTWCHLDSDLMFALKGRNKH